MQIIQFTCPDSAMAQQLIALMVNQVNIWSRLSWLTTDPDYVTAPYSADVWKTHTAQPDLYWTDWDAVYAGLGDDGRAIADQFLKPGTMTGLLLGKALLPELPETMLEIVEVDDLVAEGYVS